MPPKRKANKPVEEVAADAGLKKKRVDKEEFDDEDCDDLEVKQPENVKPKRGAKAAEQKPAVESKTRPKGKAPVKSTKKDLKEAVKPNTDEVESDSSVESKKDAPVKLTKKTEKKIPTADNKRKGRGANEEPPSKNTKYDKEVSPDIDEDEDNEAATSTTKTSKVASKSRGRAKTAQTKAKNTKKNEEDVDKVVEQDEDTPEEEPKKKAATKGSKKIVAVAEDIEDEEVEPQNSSDDEQKKKTTTAKVTKKNAKKPTVEIEAEDISSDESSKKKAPVSKRGKKGVKKPADQDEESEHEDDASGDSKKKTPAEKTSKKEIIPEEGSESEDSSDELKKKVPAARGAKKAEKTSKKEIIPEEGSESEDASSDELKKKVPAGRGAKKTGKKEVVPVTASRGRTAKTADKKERVNSTETSYEGIDFTSDKKNKAGDVPNLRIASWNVGGIRAWVKKDCLQYVLKEKPDIFCVQETKCNSENFPEEIDAIEGYKIYWHASSKEGYAGVSLWSRIEPIEVNYGIGNAEQDLDGRCITAEFEKYYVVSVYVPNAGKKLVTLPKRLEWNKLFKDYIKKLDAKKPVIICGDLNVAHKEIDLANPKTNTKNAGFTPEEREGMTEFLNEGFFDTYRNFNPDTTGAYTFWTYLGKCRSKNVGWRLDYIVTSDRLKDNLCDSVIRNGVFGSDHCPIVLLLNI